MRSLSKLFNEYGALFEKAFDLDDCGELIERDSALVAETNTLLREYIIENSISVLNELVPLQNWNHRYWRPGEEENVENPFSSSMTATGGIPTTAAPSVGAPIIRATSNMAVPSGSTQPTNNRAAAISPITNRDPLTAPLVNRAALVGASPGNNFSQKAPWIMSNLMHDFGLKDYQAAAIVGNLGHESGGFRYQQELNPTSGRGGLGWAQWTGPRRDEFEKWSADNKLDPSSDQANYGFLAHELQTTHANDLANLKNTNNADQAMRQFEGDYEGSGVKNYSSRGNFTNQALTSYQNSNHNQDVAQNTGNYPFPTQGNPTAPPIKYTQNYPSGGPRGPEDYGPGSPYGLHPPTSSTQTANSGTPEKYLAIGDSLASGVGGTLGNTKYAVGGSNPQAVNDLVNKAIKDGSVKDQHIILSGGASNAGGNTDMVNTYYPQMIKSLKDDGASQVTVMGVGPYSHFNNYGYDAAINKAAQEGGANYTGPLANIAPFSGNSIDQQVHPTDYHPIVSSIKQNYGNAQPSQSAANPSTQQVSATATSPSWFDRATSAVGDTVQSVKNAVYGASTPSSVIPTPTPTTPTPSPTQTASNEPPPTSSS